MMEHRVDSERGVTLFVINNSATARNAIDSILTQIDSYATYVEGLAHSTLIIDEKLSEVVESRLKNHIKKKITNLTALFLSFPEESLTTPGVLSLILDKFKKLNINIVQLTTTYTNVLVIISSDDADKAKELLG